ncbi:MAG: elongation factor G [Flavobacteriales bacterium]|nr:elongation factor G [Flavobacteriales bacterium]
MKSYDEKHIKNIVLLGSHGSGKTTLAETMLYEAGLLTRRGRVEDGTTVSDHSAQERERGYSTQCACLHTEWRNYKINIIDTPGLDEFSAETVPAIQVADTCILVLNARQGVEVGTELVWEHVQPAEKPVILAINQLDHPGADFDATLAQARDLLGPAVTVMQYPLEQGEGFHRIIDLLRMTMYVFKDEGSKPEKQPIPEAERERADRLHKELVEKAAENDERLMEHYFDKGELDEDEMSQGLRAGMMQRSCYPVFCLSALRNMGSGRLMGFIDNVAPSAMDMPPACSDAGGEVLCASSGPAVVYVFKTATEAHTGRVNYFKVMRGELREGQELVNAETGTVERIGQLFIPEGKERKPVDRLVAGDIGTVIKLKDAATGSTLHAKGSGVRLPAIAFPAPRLQRTMRAADTKEEEKLHSALLEIQQEDPSIQLRYNRETGERVIGIMGEIHLGMVEWKLANRYKLEVETGSPKVAYRETIRKPAAAMHRHKKQTGGSGQFAEVHLRIEPWHEGMPAPAGLPVRHTEQVDLPTGGKLVFLNCITGGVIDNRFMPSILKGVMEKMEQGPLTGSPARDIRVAVHDGKMHTVDSNDISFRIAGLMAFREAFNQADPLLMEPIHEVVVRVPEDLLGDVMTDLQGRRSIILGIDGTGRVQTIKAQVPAAELDRYSTRLRSLTQGRGTHTEVFLEYRPVPAELQQRLVQDHQRQEVPA